MNRPRAFPVVLALAVTVSACGGEPLGDFSHDIGLRQSEIIRGTELTTEESESSGLVLIKRRCTGTMLNESWVLAAAHCFDTAHDSDGDGRIDPAHLAPDGPYRVYLGNKQGNIVDDTGQFLDTIPNRNFRDPDLIVRHPNGAWQWGGTRDLALVHLRDGVSLSSTARNHLTNGRMALYPGTVSSLLGRTLTCMGYGKNNGLNGTAPWHSIGVLRRGSLVVAQVIDSDLRLVSPSGDGTHLTCNGDSGGPCFLDAVDAQGLVSRSLVGVHSTSDCDAGAGSDSWDDFPDSTWITNLVYPYEQFRQEAEITATRTSPMTILTDTAAAGDRYVAASSGTNSTSAPPSSGGVTYTFDIARADPVTWTGWANRDSPTSGAGDGEHLSALIQEGFPVCARPIWAQCRRKTDALDWTQTGDVATCTAAGGFICLNANQSDGSCDDYEVRFACPDESLRTPWVDRDDPGSGNGDGEHLSAMIQEGRPVCANPLGVECRRVGDGLDWTLTGERLICTPSAGAICINAEQSDNQCDDYEVRFVCPQDDLWTPWMNRDNPGVEGDVEQLAALKQERRDVCENPIGVQCRRVSDGLDSAHTGEVVSCNPWGGSQCLDPDQNDEACDDYEVRFACPTNAPKVGSYYLWGRAASSSSGADSFWVRADGGAWSNWNGIQGTAWHWEPVVNSNSSNAKVVLNLTTPGTHTLEVRYRERGAKIDRFFLARDPGVTPLDFEAPADRRGVNATGFATTVFSRGLDPSAPNDGGNFYSVVPPLPGANAAPDATKGTARACVRVRDGGTYNVRGTVRAPTTGTDSFWVRVDNQPFWRWGMSSTSADWRDLLVTDGNAGGAVVTVPLSVGVHCLDVYNRETGTSFNRFELVPTAP